MNYVLDPCSISVWVWEVWVKSGPKNVVTSTWKRSILSGIVFLSGKVFQVGGYGCLCFASRIWRWTCFWCIISFGIACVGTRLFGTLTRFCRKSDCCLTLVELFALSKTYYWVTMSRWFLFPGNIASLFFSGCSRNWGSDSASELYKSFVEKTKFWSIRTVCCCSSLPWRIGSVIVKSNTVHCLSVLVILLRTKCSALGKIYSNKFGLFHLKSRDEVFDP